MRAYTFGPVENYPSRNDDGLHRLQVVPARLPRFGPLLDSRPVASTTWTGVLRRVARDRDGRRHPPKAPVSKLAEYTGLKPVVGLGFLVYATFPVLLITAPADQWALVGLFAYSGLRFAGLPAHKAMIVDRPNATPAAASPGRTTSSGTRS